METDVFTHVSGINEHRPFFVIHIADVFKSVPEFIDFKKTAKIINLLLKLMRVGDVTGDINTALNKPSVRAWFRFTQIRKRI